MDEGVDESRSSWLNQGLLLAATPVIAYGLAFVYEAGFAAHFGYPISLIEVDFRLALTFWAVFFGLSVALILGPITLLPSILKPKAAIVLIGWILYLGRWLIGVLLFGLMIVTLEGLEWFGYTLIALLIAGGSIEAWWLVIEPLWRGSGGILDRWKSGLMRRREREEHERAGLVEGSVAEYFEEELSFVGNIGLVLSITIVLSFGAYWFGEINAGAKTEFPVSRGEPDLVVVRRYGSHFIASEFSRADSVLSSEFVVLSVGGDQERAWELEKIGPLTVEE